MTEPSPPRAEHIAPLPDGRTLGMAEFGPEDGFPILWFHGTPGARRQIPPLARELAKTQNVRIIGIERPGIGHSTPHLYGSLTHWAHDIEIVADDLGLEKFGLIGLSGGGPYVLACAHELPDRVVAAAVFGGVAPTHGEETAAGGLVRLARPIQPLIAALERPLGNVLSALIRSVHPIADPVFDLYVRFGPRKDGEVLNRPEMRAFFMDDLLTGSRHGLRSIVYDILLFTGPWGFKLRDIAVPVHFWQGDADLLVPFSHGAHQAALITDARFTHQPGEGHLSGLDATADAIDWILSQRSPEDTGAGKDAVAVASQSEG